MGFSIGFKISGLFHVSGFGFHVSGFGFRDSGSGSTLGRGYTVAGHDAILDPPPSSLNLKPENPKGEFRICDEELLVAQGLFEKALCSLAKGAGIEQDIKPT